MSRQCTRCWTEYPDHLIEHAFTTQRRVVDASTTRLRKQVRRPICRPCVQTQRDAKKARNRWAVKARDVIRRHAIRLRDRWPGITAEDLVRIYGWKPELLAHDAEFQYGNGCSYCGHAYQDMGHGYSDITLDVQDHDRPPYYRTNTKWCCQTCNRRKGDRGAGRFEADRQIYELWSEQKASNYNPVTDDPGSLFFGEAP